MECIKNQSVKNQTLQIALTFLCFIFLQYVMILALSRWIFQVRICQGNLQDQLDEEMYMFGGDGQTTGDIKTNQEPHKLSQFSRPAQAQANPERTQTNQQFFTGTGVTIGGSSK